METKQAEKKLHHMELRERKQLKLEGVEEVLSFDAQEVLLGTTQGNLAIRGSGLLVSGLSLENGTLEVNGCINSLTYSSKGTKSKGELFRRLLK